MVAESKETAAAQAEQNDAVLTERDGQIFIVRLNRPERLNTLAADIRAGLSEAWNTFRDDPELEVAIYTGNGRAFCAGGDLKEMVRDRGATNAAAAPAPRGNPYDKGVIDKPIIAAINGYTMGGGFIQAERADLRVAVRGAVFEMSEAKRWLLGGYAHGHIGGMSHAIATEMAFAFRFTSDRLYELGWINRLVDSVDDLIPEAKKMAEHLLSLAPATRVNTLTMMRAVRPKLDPELERLADRLRNHGSMEDLLESRVAFNEKRKPVFKGWNDPGDRARTPTLESIRREQAATA